jgi:RNA polymerase sigma factor (sigma-70 family)
VQPFEVVVEEHGAAVLRVCRALLGPADADDAWSETFLAALRAYPSLRPDSDVRAWLVTIAHRKAIDVLRAAQRRATPIDDLPVRIAHDATSADRDDDLWAALAALPFRQRSAVAHHHLAGLPYREVAALLDTTEAAARRSAADGIAALRASGVATATKRRRGS